MLSPVFIPQTRSNTTATEQRNTREASCSSQYSRNVKLVFYLFPAVKEVNAEETLSKLLPGLFFQCSASCGDGIQRREVSCRFRDRRSPLESSCSQRSRPASTQSCRLADCPPRYRWREGDWQSVSSGRAERRGIVPTARQSHQFISPSLLWLEAGDDESTLSELMKSCSFGVKPEGRRGAAVALMEIR